MNEPQSVKEYRERFAANERITGSGLGNVYMHVPCPFCAAAENIVYEILAVEEALSKGASCSECHRSWKAIFEHNGDAVSFEVVQTAGPAQPAWLVPQMRTIQEKA